MDMYDLIQQIFDILLSSSSSCPSRLLPSNDTLMQPSVQKHNDKQDNGDSEIVERIKEKMTIVQKTVQRRNENGEHFIDYQRSNKDNTEGSNTKSSWQTILVSATVTSKVQALA